MSSYCRPFELLSGFVTLSPRRQSPFALLAVYWSSPRSLLIIIRQIIICLISAPVYDSKIKPKDFLEFCTAALDVTMSTNEASHWGTPVNALRCFLFDAVSGNSSARFLAKFAHWLNAYIDRSTGRSTRKQFSAQCSRYIVGNRATSESEE